MTRRPNWPLGRLGDDAQRAALGVAAEQRALRALQHLDALDVEQRCVQALLAAEIDAVDVDADALLAGRLVGVERDDAANAHGQRRLARLEGGHAQARDGAVAEIEQALDVAVLRAAGAGNGMMATGVCWRLVSRLVAVMMMSESPLPASSVAAPATPAGRRGLPRSGSRALVSSQRAAVPGHRPWILRRGRAGAGFVGPRLFSERGLQFYIQCNDMLLKV